MGIIANFETFPNPDPAAYKPDYRAIYRYLGALLSGNETQELGPLGRLEDFFFTILCNQLSGKVDVPRVSLSD